MTQKPWQYNEMIQAGIDYTDIEIAKNYDKNMESLRDGNISSIIDKLDLRPDDIVIEFGCGTGALTLDFAKRCKKVIAVDVANPMLEVLREKAEKEGITNIEYANAGFLSYEHTEVKADVIITKMAFHHLSDFWKTAALNGMAKMLKKGGKLYISDVVFSFDIENYQAEIDEALLSAKELAGEVIYNEFIVHIKDEFSTFDWIMDEMLKRTGFEISDKDVKSHTLIDYYCIKL